MSKPKNVERNHEEIRAGSSRQFFSPTRQQLDAILLALCKNIFILAGFRLAKRNLLKLGGALKVQPIFEQFPGVLAHWPGVLAHSCNPSYREARTVGWFEV